MTRAPLVAVLVAALPACASTVDPSIAASVDTGAEVTSAPIPPEASLVELVGELAATMRHLDEQVIEGGDSDDETLARVEEIWARAMPRARDHSIDMEFGLEQAVNLARTSVQRRRPADASKGYKIAAALLTSLE